MTHDKYYCRECKGQRNHQFLFEKKIRGNDADDFVQWIQKYLVIECLGCETISFLEIYGDSEMVEYDYDGNAEYNYDETIYPLILENANVLEYQYYLPKKIKEIYAETISAFKINSYILTAGGLRAIIEALCNHLKIKNGNLSVRIDLLFKKGYLTLNESKRLHSIRFLGNDALHEIEKPKKESLYILLEIINHLLSNLFINDNIIKGKVDTIIDTYDDFLRLLKHKIKKETVGKEYSLNQLLDKSIRLISKENIIIFEKNLILEIENNTLDFIKIAEQSSEPIYEILKDPLSFDFDF